MGIESTEVGEGGGGEIRKLPGSAWGPTEAKKGLKPLIA